MTVSVTAAVERVLSAARTRATSEGESEVHPDQLFLALFHDENRASEWLTAAGMTIAKVEQAYATLFALHSAGNAVSRSRPSADKDPKPPELIPLSDQLQLILVEARSIALLESDSGDLGTEHLLLALQRVPSPVANWLAQTLAVSTDQPSSPRVAAQPTPTAPQIQTLEPEYIPQTTSSPPLDLADTFRLLDAAANRAREGLRSAEDYVRFILNDRHLSSGLKTLRHDLTATLTRLQPDRWLPFRDTPADVGTTLSTWAEQHRQSPLAVVQAAFKRLQEALRSLEEYSKVASGQVAASIEQLRYRSYTLEKGVLRTAHNQQRLAGQLVCLLVTESLCLHGSGPVILGALAAGVGLIQLREKTMPDRELLAHARRVRDWTREAGALLIINDRPDLALLCDADGVHVGQTELGVADARRIVGSERLVGVSTHSLDQAKRAVLDGADYLGTGPVFPSTTKSFAEFPGLEFVRQVASEIALPAFAIGGIKAAQISAVRAAGATRVAVSSAVCSSPDPEGACLELLDRLRS